MKKSFSLILSAVFLLLSLTSCGLTVTTVDNSTESTTESTTVTTTTAAEETTTEHTETSASVETQEKTSTTQTNTTTSTTEPTSTATTSKTKNLSYCTIEISCKTILSNRDELDPAKKDYVPANGEILKKTTVYFDDEITVFDILKQVCKENKIHLEYRFTPAYNSYYIEGIHQLYEFDCGDNSGWMYSVNGVFPNKGCNMYTVRNGDNIKLLYTCDLGGDLGAEF